MAYYVSLHMANPIEKAREEVDYPGYTRVLIRNLILHPGSDGTEEAIAKGPFTFPKCEKTDRTFGCSHFAIGKYETSGGFLAAGVFESILTVCEGITPELDVEFSVADVEKQSENEMVREARDFVSMFVTNVKTTQPEPKRQLVVLRAIADHLDMEIQELDS